LTAIYVHEVWESWNSFEAHASSFNTSRFGADALRYLDRPVEILQFEEIL
jgi:quinol monooxygenase YgiN